MKFMFETLSWTASKNHLRSAWREALQMAEGTLMLVGHRRLTFGSTTIASTIWTKHEHCLVIPWCSQPPKKWGVPHIYMVFSPEGTRRSTRPTWLRNVPACAEPCRAVPSAVWSRLCRSAHDLVSGAEHHVACRRWESPWMRSSPPSPRRLRDRPNDETGLRSVWDSGSRAGAGVGVLEG